MTCCHASARCVLIRAIIVAIFLMLLSQTLAAAEIYDQVVGLAPMTAASPGKGLAVFLPIVVVDVFGELFLILKHDLPLMRNESPPNWVRVVGGTVQTLVSFGWIALFIVGIVLPIDLSIGAVVFVAFVWLRAVAQAASVWDAQCKRTVILGEDDFYAVLIRHANMDRVLSLVREGARSSTHCCACLATVAGSPWVRAVILMVLLLVGEVTSVMQLVLSTSGQQCGLTSLKLCSDVGRAVGPGAAIVAVDVAAQTWLVFRHDIRMLNPEFDPMAKAVRWKARAAGVAELLVALAWLGLFVFAVAGQRSRRQFGFGGAVVIAMMAKESLFVALAILSSSGQLPIILPTKHLLDRCVRDNDDERLNGVLLAVAGVDADSPTARTTTAGAGAEMASARN
jgi:hypothetical protein